MSSRILIVKDETRVAHAIERGLAASGFDVVVVTTGEEGYFTSCCRRRPSIW
jgi:DNA-binding response OmpR family regulator